MKNKKLLSALLVIAIAGLRAPVDVVALKKSIAEESAVAVKQMVDDAEKMALEFKLQDVQSELLVKTYPKSEHEALRAEEAKKLVDRVNTKAQKLSDELSAMVEKAFVDVMKEQQRFQDLCKQDIAAFKQQFSENIQKMLQGKKATPITYSASEGVVKGSAEEKKASRSMAIPKQEPAAVPAPVEKMEPFKALPETSPLSTEKPVELVQEEVALPQQASSAAPSFSMGTPADSPAPVAPAPKPEQKKAEKSSPRTSNKKSVFAPSKAQADLLKQIRG